MEERTDRSRSGNMMKESAISSEMVIVEPLIGYEYINLIKFRL